MSKYSRDKGKRGEREVIHILQPIINKVCDYNNIERIILQRNTLQSDRGGYDIVGLDDFAIEVKRVEKLYVKRWWEQAQRQAKGSQIPVLFYRQSRKPWTVKTQLIDNYGNMEEKEMTLEQFLEVFENYLKNVLTKDKF